MPDSQLQRRRKLYFKLSAEIAQISNEQLQSMLNASATTEGWGKNNVIEVAGSKVFVKRVPITELEYENMYSTRNFYDLPTYYNYGYNSAGLGVFRELVAHIKTTNWVLDEEIATFPLMYSYRIIPWVGPHEGLDEERLARYVTYWGSNENVERYRRDRANAGHELVLFLEYIPYTMSKWLADNPTKMPMVVDDLQATVAFLRSKGMLHLDGHFSNVVTDGKHAYLTDFGLVIDKHFELSPGEKDFFRQNSYYDYGMILWSLAAEMFHVYAILPSEEKAQILKQVGLESDDSFEETFPALLNNVESLVANGSLKINKVYLETVLKYRDISLLLHDFYSTMRTNNRKDTHFKSATLLKMLKETGFVPPAG